MEIDIKPVRKMDLLIDSCVWMLRVLNSIFRVVGAVIIVANSLTGAASTQPYFDGLTFISFAIIFGYSANLIDEHLPPRTV